MYTFVPPVHGRDAVGFITGGWTCVLLVTRGWNCVLSVTRGCICVANVLNNNLCLHNSPGGSMYAIDNGGECNKITFSRFRINMYTFVPPVHGRDAVFLTQGSIYVANM